VKVLRRYVAKAPTRVDLAGGTLDLWPFYALLGECWTINFAIDVYSQVSLDVLDGKTVSLHSEDLGCKREYQSLESCLERSADELSLLKQPLGYFRPEVGLRLQTKSFSPVGAGLGGSSSLMMCMLKTFSKAFERSLSVSEMVELAHNLEARVLKTPTGTQDYYPPALGGLLALKYTDVGCEYTKLNNSLIEDKFFLVYTGKPHHSGLNNWQIFKALIDEDLNTWKCLEQLRRISDDMYQALSQNSSGAITDLLRQEYEWRVKLSPVFTCSEIERLEKTAMTAGAEAVKICGAGGGGCVMIWCGQEKRERVKEQCRKDGFQVLDAKLVKQGVQIQKT
jgi:D-glycero-alpha-D-manno-heptose-7-phosphate kinase